MHSLLRVKFRQRVYFFSIYFYSFDFSVSILSEIVSSNYVKLFCLCSHVIINYGNCLNEINSASCWYLGENLQIYGARCCLNVNKSLRRITSNKLFYLTPCWGSNFNIGRCPGPEHLYLSRYSNKAAAIY